MPDVLIQYKIISIVATALFLSCAEKNKCKRYLVKIFKFNFVYSLCASRL